MCDGDLDIPQQSYFQSSVIIVNGTIRCPVGPSVEKTAFYATGDIEMPDRSTAGNGLFHAGGAIKFREKVTPFARLQENQKTLPFGIRFLNPKDFGLDVAVQNGGTQVMGITPESPFAKFGVADGDVIVTIDDVRADALPTFRRQLRKGVLKESVTLGIRRGNQRLTRIVFLDGVPEPARPLAPLPRELRK